MRVIIVVYVEAIQGTLVVAGAERVQLQLPLAPVDSAALRSPRDRARLLRIQTAERRWTAQPRLRRSHALARLPICTP